MNCEPFSEIHLEGVKESFSRIDLDGASSSPAYKFEDALTW